MDLGRHTARLPTLAALLTSLLAAPPLPAVEGDAVPLEAAEAAAGVVVTRRVEADVLARPVPVGRGAQQACPDRLEPPAAGDEVVLRAAAQMARRDEPSLSFVVRLDRGKAFVLHHASSTYSELAFPPKPRALATKFRTAMGRAAADVFPYEVRGDVEQQAGQAGEHATTTHSATVQSPLGGGLDVAVEVLPDAELAEAALAVEDFAQAVRRAGERWLDLLDPPAGVPLTLREDARLPDSTARRREVFVDLERRPLDESLFAPPAGYRKIDHAPDCFYTP